MTQEAIPVGEMERDRYETIEDIQNCEFALSQGVTSYCDGKESVQERLDTNRQILDIIETRLRNLGIHTSRPDVPKPVFITNDPAAAGAISAFIMAANSRRNAP